MKCRFVCLLTVLVWALSISVSLGQSTQADEFVRIEKVRVLLSQQGPVVLLMVHDRAIPIYVDPTVAGSIEGVLSGRKFHRPLSHDLMHTILQAYGGQVVRVHVRLQEKIYYGEVTVTLNGEEKVFDSRSSDAIALAIHFEAPIMVGKDLLEGVGQKGLGDENPPQLL